MDNNSITQRAYERHIAARRPRLTSWYPLRGNRGVIATTALVGTTPPGKVVVERCTIGALKPMISSWLTAAQARVDNDLSLLEGEAWQDAWFEGELLSALADIWSRPLLSCKASPERVRSLILRFEESCRRVRSRLTLPSAELSPLAAAIRSICQVRAACAA